MNTLVQRKVLSLSYQATVFEEFDVLKKNSHKHNEQTVTGFNFRKLSLSVHVSYNNKSFHFLAVHPKR